MGRKEELKARSAFNTAQVMTISAKRLKAVMIVLEATGNVYNRRIVKRELAKAVANVLNIDNPSLDEYFNDQVLVIYASIDFDLITEVMMDHYTRG